MEVWHIGKPVSPMKKTENSSKACMVHRTSQEALRIRLEKSNKSHHQVMSNWD